MKKNDQHTITEKLLMAACELAGAENKTFSAEDLVVEAWKKFPDTFGLSGHRNEEGNLMYPDSNRIFVEIMGSKPIREKGYLKKVGEKMYQVTEAGREKTNMLLSNSANNKQKRAGLQRDVERQLKRLFSTRTWIKFKNNNFEEIHFYDACEFWGITPRSSSIDYDGKIANLIQIIQSVQKTIENEEVAFSHGGYTFGKLELAELLELHEQMIKKFEQEIAFIKKRKSEK